MVASITAMNTPYLMKHLKPRSQHKETQLLTVNRALAELDECGVEMSNQ